MKMILPGEDVLAKEPKENLLRIISVMRGENEAYDKILPHWIKLMKENKELQERIKILENLDDKVKREPLTDKVVKMW